jgi:hypothetical protein
MLRPPGHEVRLPTRRRAGRPRPGRPRPSRWRSARPAVAGGSGAARCSSCARIRLARHLSRLASHINPTCCHGRLARRPSRARAPPPPPEPRAPPSAAPPTTSVPRAPNRGEDQLHRCSTDAVLSTSMVHPCRCEGSQGAAVPPGRATAVGRGCAVEPGGAAAASVGAAAGRSGTRRATAGLKGSLPALDIVARCRPAPRVPAAPSTGSGAHARA